MSYQAKIKRYIQILQQLDQRKCSSLATMIDSIRQTGIKVSERQLKRDIESLKFEFGLDIHYSSRHRGYCLESGQLSFPYFMKLIEFSQNIELMTDYLKKGLDITEIMNFEDFNSFKGIEFIHDLALAIHHGREIKIEYKRFNSDHVREHVIQPYLLREYLNRWYVVGSKVENGAIRTYGLDRIICFSETGNKFKREKLNSIHSLFKNIVGINASLDDKPGQVLLRCNPYMGNFLKSLPLHPSQKVVSENDDYTDFSLYVVDNLELRQRLMMIANQAWVINPPSLKEEIQQMIRDAQQFYQS